MNIFIYINTFYFIFLTSYIYIDENRQVDILCEKIESFFSLSIITNIVFIFVFCLKIDYLQNQKFTYICFTSFGLHKVGLSLFKDS